MKLRNRLLLITDPNDGGTPPTDPPAGTPPPEPPAATPPASDDGLPKTQAELDKLLQRRLAQQEKQLTTKAEETARQAQMTEAEKAKADKDAALQKAVDAEAKANKRVVLAEARVALAGAGVKAEALPDVLKLLELNDVTVDDDSEPDTAAIAKAVTALKGRLPELFGAAGTPKAGGAFGGGNPGEPAFTSREQIQKLMIEKPDEYKRRYPEIMAWYQANAKKG